VNGELGEKGWRERKERVRGTWRLTEKKEKKSKLRGRKEVQTLRVLLKYEGHYSWGNKEEGMLEGGGVVRESRYLEGERQIKYLV